MTILQQSLKQWTHHYKPTKAALDSRITWPVERKLLTSVKDHKVNTCNREWRENMLVKPYSHDRN